MRLLKIDHRFRRVYEISGEWLTENGITALILDVDNTLTEHDSQFVDDRVISWLDGMRRLNIKLIILSNNHKKRVMPFAQKLGLDYIADGMKPLTSGIKRAIAKLDVDRENIAIVGDQIFTDILGGNLARMTTILLEPISPEKGSFMRFKRRFECYFK